MGLKLTGSGARAHLKCACADVRLELAGCGARAHLERGTSSRVCEFLKSLSEAGEEKGREFI